MIRECLPMKDKNRIGRHEGGDVRQQGYFLPVQDLSKESADEEISQVGQQWEIVRGDEIPGDKPQRRQPIKVDQIAALDIQTHSGKDNAQHRQRPGRELAKNRPQEHTGSQTVENAEIDDDIFSGKTDPIQGRRYCGDGQAAADDLQTPAHRAAAQGDAQTGQQQER